MHEDAWRERALQGALWGTAIGDALGLPYEGLDAREVAGRAGALDRYALVGRRGFVSDDTEQSALVVESVTRARGDVHESVRVFRRALLGWFLRLPFGIGLATLRACLRILLGRARSGVRSAGNGAAMRSAPIGVLFADDEARRRALARSLAMVTHTDARAVEGAMYVAELAAQCALDPEQDRGVLALRALAVVQQRELRETIQGAILLAGSEHDDLTPFANHGFVVHTLAIACFAFVRSGHTYVGGVRHAIRAGGDTDTNAAIVGAWLGVLHGPDALPSQLLASLSTGPFGATHLAGLARAACSALAPPRWSAMRALVRNLALFPVILAHGWLRLLASYVPSAWTKASSGARGVVHHPR